MKKNIIIDTDPGIDDAFALAYAFVEERFNILGISTVSGNNGIDKVTKNALRLVRFFGLDLEVYKGLGRPLRREASQGGGECHGEDGLGGVGQDLDYGQANQLPAVDFIISQAASQKDLTLVALGPLTNIARAIELDPQAMKNVKEIVSMGGGIGRGNVTEFAEFNYWADPEAAKLVFDFSIPITMVGLNATDKSFFSIQEFEAMRDEGRELGRLLYEMQKVYTSCYKSWYGIEGCRIHDLLAMMAAIDRDILVGQQAGIDLSLEDGSQGMTSIRTAGRQNVFVAMDADVEAYKTLFYRKLLNMKK